MAPALSFASDVCDAGLVVDKYERSKSEQERKQAHDKLRDRISGHQVSSRYRGPKPC